jgi:hypothetical protein
MDDRTDNGSVSAGLATQEPFPSLQSRSRLVPLALSLLPLAYLIWTCRRLFVDVPYADAWDLVWRLDRLDLGTLSIRDVWGQHNEHRPMFPILLMLGLAELTGWNLSAEVAVNVVLGIALFTVCALHVARLPAADRGVSLWSLPVLSLVIFSLGQWENWLWGWQMQLFMGVLASTAGWWLLAKQPGSRWALAGSIACGIVTTYSFAAGLTYWFVGLPALWLHPAHRTRFRIAAWLTAGAATIGSYFYDYQQSASHLPLSINFGSVHTVWNWLAFIARNLGAPVALYDARVAAGAGVLAGLAFLYLAVRLRARRHDAAYLFPALVGMHAITGAVLTALGRAPLGGLPIVSRYTTAAGQLWVAVVLLACVAIASRPVITSRPVSTWRPALAGPRRAAALLAAAALCLSLLFTGRQGVAEAQDLRSTLRAARTALIRDSNPKLIGWLFNNSVAEVKHRRRVLRMLRMWIYRDEP